ncbi:MAG TPA: NDP-sugar synthase [Candidatus Deferrimicrobium sp.]|nr:NDP-sugar synthase [Candidatus Deferrimicrobium sp.]
MKGIILAAGFGKRMGALTETLPKSLIPVINKPILQHLIETLNQSGIDDFIIVVGHQKEQVISFLNNFKKKDIKISIKVAKDFNKGPLYSFSSCMGEIENEEFILIPTDLLIEPSMLIELLQRSKNQKFTLAFDDRAIISPHTTVHISKTEQSPRILGITSNIIGGNSETKSLIPILICRINFEPYIKLSLKANHTKVIDAIQLYLQEKNDIFGLNVKEKYWFDLDTIEDVLKANKFLLNHLKENQQLLTNLNDNYRQNISLNPPILIGKNCHFQNNCRIGPYVSIGDNTSCRTQVTLENAIILPNSIISNNVEIQNAIFFKEIYQ